MATLLNRRRFLLVIATAVLSAISFSAQRRERIVNTWKPLHYDVELAFNDQLSEIESARSEIKVVILKDSVKTIDLDFGAMAIDSVSLNGEPAPYDRQSELLNVQLPRFSKNGEQVSIMVTYHGRPKDGLIRANDRDGKPSATGDNWPNRVHQWIPCLDHPSAKATVSFTVAAPRRDVVVANGKFVATTPNGAQNVWKFEEAESIPAYCMVVSVTE